MGFPAHIHWIANAVSRPPPSSLSGGDRIMVECLRRWTGRHRVTVYGWEGTRRMCDYLGLQGVEHALWPLGRLANTALPVQFVAQSLAGFLHARNMRLHGGERHVLVSSSDFLPDSLPALCLKRNHPDIPWVAAFYLFAPPLRDWLSGEPGAGLGFAAYRPVQRWVLRRILRRSEMILVTGEEDRERMIALGRHPDSVFAVRGGVDLSIPRSVPEPIEKSYDAVFIGRFHPQKGVREVLQIWKLLQETRPGARLAMIGKGPLEGELRRLRESLGLETSVAFLGFQDGVEKYKVVKSSRVVVHPAVYDSGGMAPAEALACGLPGVAFDLPSLKTYYPRGFLKAPQGDLRAFATQLGSLLSDPTLYASMAVEAASAGREWDWDVRAEQVLEAVMRVVPRHGG